MAQITLKNAAGNDAGHVELDDAVFGVQPNVPLMHQVVTAQLANRRAGTQSTKTRSEVRGGGAKPYRQKGTGNARQGSVNAPQYTGGGVALGPKPRGYGQRTPKKMIRAALRSALSDRANEGRVVVVEGWDFAGPRTKDAKAALAALGIEGRVLVVIESFETAPALSFRNLPEVQLIKVGELNAYDVLCNDWIVFEQHHLPTAGAPVGGTVPTTASATTTVSDEPSVHPQDPAEGAPDGGIDEPVPSEHPQDPAEGRRDDADLEADADLVAAAEPIETGTVVDAETGSVVDAETGTSSEDAATGGSLEHGEAQPSTEARVDREAAHASSEDAATGGSLEHGEAQPSTEARVDREAP